jgi:hypothetical protein
MTMIVTTPHSRLQASAGWWTRISETAKPGVGPPRGPPPALRTALRMCVPCGTTAGQSPECRGIATILVKDRSRSLASLTATGTCAAEVKYLKCSTNTPMEHL